MAGKFLVASNDNTTIRRLQLALRDERHTTIVARDGLETVDLALDRAPDAIFLGMELAGLDGVEVARALRALDPTEHVPIVFLVLNEDEANHISNLRLPFTEHIHAPYDVNEIKIHAAAALRARERIAALRTNNVDTTLLAITDPLTRLYQRRYLMHRLTYEAARSARYKNALSVLLVDVDNLKTINAEHGILIGDSVLIETGQVLMKLARKTDIVGRYDTRDFLTLMPETDAPGTLIFANRILKYISGHHFLDGKLNLRVSISVGAASANGSDLAENLALIGRAEAALEHAKRAGKNRVEVE